MYSRTYLEAQLILKGYTYDNTDDMIQTYYEHINEYGDKENKLL